MPVAEGGGLCGLSNLRTLCTPCHRSATRALRRRLTAAAASEKAPDGAEASRPAGEVVLPAVQPAAGGGGGEVAAGDAQMASAG